MKFERNTRNKLSRPSGRLTLIIRMITHLLIMHSVATRLFLSWDRQAVTMASEIWSQILSGCPHETCSLVKIIKKSSFRMYGCVKGGKTHPTKKKEPTENSVDPHCFSGKYNNITSKEKSQCKISANFSSELTSLFS